MPYFFFFNDTATTEIYTLSLHDALPILSTSGSLRPAAAGPGAPEAAYCSAYEREEQREEARDRQDGSQTLLRDRKSTRLNSSHANISYAVFCLKKKNTNADMT